MIRYRCNRLTLQYLNFNSCWTTRTHPFSGVFCFWPGEPQVTSTCPAAVNDNYFYIVVLTAEGQAPFSKDVLKGRFSGEGTESKILCISYLRFYNMLFENHLLASSQNSSCGQQKSKSTPKNPAKSSLQSLDLCTWTCWTTCRDYRILRKLLYP